MCIDYHGNKYLINTYSSRCNDDIIVYNGLHNGVLTLICDVMMTSSSPPFPGPPDSNDLQLSGGPWCYSSPGRQGLLQHLPS